MYHHAALSAFKLCQLQFDTIYAILKQYLTCEQTGFLQPTKPVTGKNLLFEEIVL